MDDFEEAMAFGTGYAFYRHGQDRLAAQFRAALHEVLSEHLPLGETIDTADRQPGPGPRQVDLEFDRDLDEVIGHGPIRQQLRLHVESARVRHGRLPHLLLSSSTSGVGRRTLVRAAAKELGKNLVELVPPFSFGSLVDAVGLLGQYDILYIDDLHVACQRGSPGSQVLVDLFDHELADEEGENQYVPEITIAGSTTLPSAVPSGLRDRFVVRLDLPDPSWAELGRRVVEAAGRYRALDQVDDELAVKIARMCMGAPWAIEGMVVLARDLAITLGRPPFPEELAAWVPDQ